MTTVIYVAGYGRSGSTLLDLLLGTHAEIRSLGEVGLIWDEISAPDASCSCGALLRNCPAWSPALRAMGGPFDVRAAGRDASAIERWTGGPRRADPAAARRYRESHARLFADTAGASGATYVVDSSKTAYRFAWRPRALAELGGFDVRVLHLIRNPSAVLASTIKGRNSRLAAGRADRRAFEVPITLAGWNLANLFAAANGHRLGRDRYLCVDFDQLLRSPEDGLARIGRFIGLDLSAAAALVRSGGVLPVGHLVAANRVARGGPVRVDATRPAVPATLGFFHRLAVNACCGPLYRLLRRRMN